MLRRISLVLLAIVISVCILPMWSFAEESQETNYVVNGDFEEMDGSPDYEPNNWTVVKGWFVEAIATKAASGDGYMVAVQSAEGYQDISGIPAGKYTLSAYIAPLLNVESITLRISFGENVEEIVVEATDSCDYFELDGLEITGGTARITLLYTSLENFNSTAIIDDIKLIAEPEATPTPEPTATIEPTDVPATEAPNATDVPTVAQKTEDDGNSGVIIGVIIAAVVIAGVVAFILIKRKK